MTHFTTKYDDFNMEVLRNRQRDQEKHNKKIAGTQCSINVRGEDNRIAQQIASMRYHRQINKEFNRVTRNIMLSHDNQILVDRMEAIHFAKGGSEIFGGPPTFKKKKKSEPVTVGSLNYQIRQMENERIFKANQILFNKLKDSKPSLPKAHHDDHYNQSRKYLKIVSKEPQLRLIAQMNLGLLPTTPKIARSPSVSVLMSESSKTKLPPITTRHRGSVGIPQDSVDKVHPREHQQMRKTESQTQMHSNQNPAPTKYKLKKNTFSPDQFASDGQQDEQSVQPPNTNRSDTVPKQRQSNISPQKNYVKTQKNFREKEGPGPFIYSKSKYSNAIAYGTYEPHQGSKDKKRKRGRKAKKSKSKAYDTANLNLRSSSSLTPDREERKRKSFSPRQTSERSSLSKSKKIQKTKDSVKNMILKGSDDENISKKKKKSKPQTTHLDIKSNIDQSGENNQRTLTLSADCAQGDHTQDNEARTDNERNNKQVNQANQPAQ